MPKELDAIGVAARLRAACDEAGGQEAFAAKHGMSRKTVNDAITGRRFPPGPFIIAALKLRKVTRYVEIDS